MREKTSTRRQFLTRLGGAAIGANVASLADRNDESAERPNIVLVLADDLGSNRPWRGAKQHLYEGGIRVPFIAWWPGRIPSGRVRDDTTAGWDLFPTFAELASARLRERVDGVSLMPALTGGGPVRRDCLYWEFQGKLAVRLGNWKALRDARRNTKLYDLSSDPGEARNLAAENRETASRLGRVMDAARVESERYPLVPKRSR